MIFVGVTREQHSEDWSAWIHRIGEHRWVIHFESRAHSSWFRREDARQHIRVLKKGKA